MTAPALAPECLTDPDLYVHGDPHAVWRWMREHSAVHRHAESDQPAFWSLTRHADVRAVYRDPHTFSSARGVLLRPAAAGEDPGSNLTLALTDPPKHKLLRALVAAWFTERSVRSIEQSIRDAVRVTVDRAVEQGRCEVVHDIAGRLSISVICGLLGVPVSDQDDVFRWTDEAYAAHTPLAAHQPLMHYFSELMYSRMQSPRDDIVSALANGLLREELLTEQEILLNIENLVGATENGRLAIAGGIQALLDYPDEWQRLRDDPHLVPTAVEEVLRWTSSATHSMRTTTRAVQIGDQQLAAGDRVVVWVPAANRDPAVFLHPDRFDVARAPNRHLALGAGEHFCLGSTLARTQLRALLNHLVDAGACFDNDGPTRAVRSIAVGGPEVLPVRMRRR